MRSKDKQTNEQKQNMKNNNDKTKIIYKKTIFFLGVGEDYGTDG